MPNPFTRLYAQIEGPDAWRPPGPEWGDWWRYWDQYTEAQRQRIRDIVREVMVPQPSYAGAAGLSAIRAPAQYDAGPPPSPYSFVRPSQAPTLQHDLPPAVGGLRRLSEADLRWAYGPPTSETPRPRPSPLSLAPMAPAFADLYDPAWHPVPEVDDDAAAYNSWLENQIRLLSRGY